ncbi:hypothetical protein ACHWQZ_G003591 [Mnemiopsis leidyi]
MKSRHSYLFPALLPETISDHLRNASVYMMVSDEDALSVSQTSNSSTPRKKKKTPSPLTSPATSSSQPLPKTMSPLLNPSEKIASRLRTFSQTSDISQSESGKVNLKNPKKKSGSVPKRITDDGTYTLDPRKKTCTLQYMEEYIDMDEADRLQGELKTHLEELYRERGEANKNKQTCEIDLNTDRDLSSADLPDSVMTQQIGFLAKRLERSMCSVFDVNTSFSSVHIRRLPNYLDHIPYESLSGKNGANPVVAMLALGAPRLLKLKKGTRITHVVSLHPGSLCVLSGNTSFEYSHSVPKVQADTKFEQIMLFFVGTPSNIMAASDSESASSVVTDSSLDGGTSTADERSENDLDSDQSEINYTSLLQKVECPVIKITPTTPEACAVKTEEVMSDIINIDLGELTSPTSDHTDEGEVEHSSKKDQEKQAGCPGSSLSLKPDDGGTNFCFNTPHTPEECEQTVIQIVDSPANETINACAYYLPESVLNEELARNRCPTTGSLFERRSRMSKLLSLHQRKVSDCHRSDNVPPVSWTQSMLENTQLDIKEQIRKLSDEIIDMRTENGMCNNTKNIEKLLEENKKLTSSLKDAWERNLSAASQIKNQIDEFFREIHIAELKSDELEKSLRTLKCDLKNYYNSAFFREDSELIKKIHKAVTSTNSPDLPSGHPTAPPQSPVRPSNPPPAPSAPPLSPHRTQSERTTPIVHQGSDFTSRRSAGFTMTQSANFTRGIQAPRTSQTPKQFKTVMITDSILRHVKDMDTINALGINHQLYLFNKRDTSGLSDPNLRNRICELKPDFIYIHLGVNDITQRIPLKQILSNIYGFNLFTDDHLPTSKTILSLPLMTGDPMANEDIAALRDCLTLFVNELNKKDCRPLRNRDLFLNQNSNFVRDGHIVHGYYSNDFVHPSERGKTVLLVNDLLKGST